MQKCARNYISRSVWEEISIAMEHNAALAEAGRMQFALDNFIKPIIITRINHTPRNTWEPCSWAMHYIGVTARCNGVVMWHEYPTGMDAPGYGVHLHMIRLGARHSIRVYLRESKRAVLPQEVREGGWGLALHRPHLMQRL
jgi:hypothetical protein